MTRSVPSGCCASRKSVHASALDVVSWLATKAMVSSPTSSASSSGGASLAPGPDQPREDVVSLGTAGPPPGDQVEHRRLDPFGRAEHARVRRSRPGPLEESHAERRVHLEPAIDRPGDVLRLPRVVHREERRAADPDRQAVHLVQEVAGLPRPPTVEHSVDGREDRSVVRVEGRPRERRDEQTAMALVDRPVEVDEAFADAPLGRRLGPGQRDREDVERVGISQDRLVGAAAEQEGDLSALAHEIALRAGLPVETDKAIDRIAQEPHVEAGVAEHRHAGSMRLRAATAMACRRRTASRSGRLIF